MVAWQAMRRAVHTCSHRGGRAGICFSSPGWGAIAHLEPNRFLVGAFLDEAMADAPMTDAPPPRAEELETLRASERQLELQLAQQRRREGALVLRVAVKDRELREAREALQRSRLTPQHVQVETLMLDPAVNGEIMKLREQVLDPTSLPPHEPRAHLTSHPGDVLPSLTVIRDVWACARPV